mmetsp:Transcript_24643/g.55313  ORF Transcript_24643/g.55313 Transcript_24643/m.55313 type:complete len:251 (+) Transcript_24643:153-905(+)
MIRRSEDHPPAHLVLQRPPPLCPLRVVAARYELQHRVPRLNELLPLGDGLAVRVVDSNQHEAAAGVVSVISVAFRDVVRRSAAPQHAGPPIVAQLHLLVHQRAQPVQQPQQKLCLEEGRLLLRVDVRGDVLCVVCAQRFAPLRHVEPELARFRALADQRLRDEGRSARKAVLVRAPELRIVELVEKDVAVRHPDVIVQRDPVPCSHLEVQLSDETVRARGNGLAGQRRGADAKDDAGCLRRVHNALPLCS